MISMQNLVIEILCVFDFSPQTSSESFISIPVLAMSRAFGGSGCGNTPKLLLFGFDLLENLVDRSDYIIILHFLISANNELINFLVF